MLPMGDQAHPWHCACLVSKWLSGRESCFLLLLLFLFWGVVRGGGGLIDQILQKLGKGTQERGMITDNA